MIVESLEQDHAAGRIAVVTRSSLQNQLLLFERFWCPWRPRPTQEAYHGSTALEHKRLRWYDLQLSWGSLVCHQNADRPLPFLASFGVLGVHRGSGQVEFIPISPL